MGPNSATVWLTVFPFPFLFSSYLLKKQITVEATNMNFPDVTLKRRLEEVRFPH